MASCRSTSFYLAPGVYRKFSRYALAAVLPGGAIVEVSHRRMIKDLMRDHPLWDGLVLCVNRTVLGKSSIVDALINKPASVERWHVDERVIEGRRPTGKAYTLHRLAHGGVEAIGGIQQVTGGLLATSDPSVRRAGVNLIKRAGPGAAYRISVALAAQGFLDTHTIANLLRTKTPYEHATFAPVDVESTRAAFAVMQARYPNEYRACIVQMLDGSTLGPTWLGEYFSQRYISAGLGTYHHRGQYGKHAWMQISKLYGLGEGWGRNIEVIDRDGATTLRNYYRLSGTDEQAARSHLMQYLQQLTNGADLPEPATLMELLREAPDVVPYSVLHDPRMVLDSATVHQLIMGLIERTKPDINRGEGGSALTVLGKPHPLYTQGGEEAQLYEAVAHHNFPDETVESLLAALAEQHDEGRRRVLGSVIQIALYNGALTPVGMERIYARLRTLHGKPGSLEARLVEALLARRDLPVEVAEAHVREHMHDVEDVVRAVMYKGTSGFGGGWVAYPRKQTTDTYSALGVAFSNPGLLAASPYLREQAMVFVQVGLRTLGDASELSAKYGNGEPSTEPVYRGSLHARRTGAGADSVLQAVAEGLVTCEAGSEPERGEALRTYAAGQRRVAKAEQHTALAKSDTLVMEHFSVYQPSTSCSTLDELWRDYCSVHQGGTYMDPNRTDFPQRWYANVAVNPHVGAALRKLAYDKSDHLLQYDAFGNEIWERLGTHYEHLYFLERVVGARNIESDLRETALARHLEKQSAYVLKPSPYGGLPLAVQIASDTSATERMLATVIAGIEKQAADLTKRILEHSGREGDQHVIDEIIDEALEIDLILHTIGGRSLTGEAAEAWQRGEKIRPRLREMVEVCVKNRAEREAMDHTISSDEHRHQRALANGAVVASLDEGRLEEMLNIFERERTAAAHDRAVVSVAWPEQITSVKDLPGYGHLPFTGIEEFSERIDGSDYRFPRADANTPKLARVETVSSGGELRQNAEYMGNCTDGYARSIARGLTRIVAVYDTEGNCALNLSFERRGGNASCPVEYRPLVMQILNRLNEGGDGWSLSEINTRFNGLGSAWERDWEEGDWTHYEPEETQPLLQMGTASAAEEQAWAIQEQFDARR